jgi:hypothetical protein
MARRRRKKTRETVAENWARLQEHMTRPESPLSPGVLEEKAQGIAESMLQRYRSGREAAWAASENAYNYDSDHPNHHFWRRVHHLIMSESRSKRNPLLTGTPKPLRPPDPRLPPKLVGSPIGIPLPAFRAAPNPKGQWGVNLPALSGLQSGEFFDPRLESIRSVARAKGFGIAVGKYVRDHTVGEITRRSWERHQDPDHLLRGRQAYELKIGKTRGAGTYRITPEVTRSGIRYFVWPMKMRQQLPKGYSTYQEAEDELGRRQGTPARTTLRRKCYTKADLSDWLPPDSIFAGMDNHPTRAFRRGRGHSTLPGEPCSSDGRPVAKPKAKTKKTAPRKAAPRPAPRQPTRSAPGPCNGKSLADAYREASPEWYKDPVLRDRFSKGLCP